MPRVLVHLASGVGNIVLATPLLIALSEMDFEIDVLLHADYSETKHLLSGWQILRRIIDGHLAPCPRAETYDHVLPAIPPFYWQRYRRSWHSGKNTMPRPQDALFYQNEQEYYLVFARQLGYPKERRPYFHLPIKPSDRIELRPNAVVLAPGCKTGEMARKRWPYFAELAERFENVVIVGTEDDMYDHQKRKYVFPHSACSFVGKLTLRETAELLAAANVMVGNDAGLTHVAAALGVATIMIFGPTPHRTLGPLPPHVKVLRSALPCEPCWFNARFRACMQHIDCLQQLTVERVEGEVRSILRSL